MIIKKYKSNLNNGFYLCVSCSGLCSLNNNGVCSSRHRKIKEYKEERGIKEIRNGDNCPFLWQTFKKVYKLEYKIYGLTAYLTDLFCDELESVINKENEDLIKQNEDRKKKAEEDKNAVAYTEYIKSVRNNLSDSECLVFDFFNEYENKRSVSINIIADSVRKNKSVIFPIIDKLINKGYIIAEYNKDKPEMVYKFNISQLNNMWKLNERQKEIYHFIKKSEKPISIKSIRKAFDISKRSLLDDIKIILYNTNLSYIEKEGIKYYH